METAMLTKYKEQVAPALMEKFKYANVHQIPRIEKVALNCGFGNATDERKAVSEIVMDDIATITGQRPVPTYAKNAISNFKLRAGEVIGARLTLRGSQMWEFLDRLLNAAIPTIRDFRGVSPKSFDGRGNYTLGITDHTIFPEIELDKVKRAMGLDVTIVTSALNDDEAREMLALLGMAFRKPAEAEPVVATRAKKDEESPAEESESGSEEETEAVIA
jgi:large subunit ribosomal protein L5